VKSSRDGPAPSRRPYKNLRGKKSKASGQRLQYFQFAAVASRDRG